MGIFIISFLFCVNPSRILSGKRAWQLRQIGATISRMMNASLIAPLARYLYQGRDRGYQESLMPPAKNTSAPQTYSTSTCSTNYSNSKPTSWFHSLTNRLKMLVPHSQCFELLFTSINKIVPKHTNTQERIIYPYKLLTTMLDLPKSQQLWTSILLIQFPD